MVDSVKSFSQVKVYSDGCFFTSNTSINFVSVPCQRSVRGLFWSEARLVVSKKVVGVEIVVDLLMYSLFQYFREGRTEIG